MKALFILEILLGIIQVFGGIDQILQDDNPLWMKMVGLFTVIGGCVLIIVGIHSIG